MYFNLLHLNKNPPRTVLSAFARWLQTTFESKNCAKSDAASLLNPSFCLAGFKKGTGCTTCSPWPECQNHTSCIIWQVIIIKVLKSQQIHVTARSGLHESIQSDISTTFVSTETKPFLSALDCLCNRCIIERAFVKKVCQWNKSDRLKLTKKG